MASDDVISLLRNHPGSRLALSGHLRPDGDSLGACFALAEILLSLGHVPQLVNPGRIPEKFSFLARPEWVVNHSHAGWWRDFDLFGALDCGEIERLPEINREAARNLPVFNLDHHASCAGFGQAVWVDPAASSASELVVRLARAAGWVIPPRAAQALWTGIVFDTGRFSQENATPAALEAARFCLLAGANPVFTETRLFQSTSPGERRLQGRLLQRLELLAGGKLAISWIREDDFREFGLNPDLSYDLSSLLRGITGVEASILFTESGHAPPSGVKASMRTVSPHDAIKVTGLFGGGGHARAAGCSFVGGLDEAKRMLVAAAVREFFPEADAID